MRAQKQLQDVDRAIKINVLRSIYTWKQIEQLEGADAYKCWKQAGYQGRREGRRDLTYPQ